MFQFLSENLGTILVGAILLAIIALIVIKMVKDKKSGSSCGSCKGCPSSSICGGK